MTFVSPTPLARQTPLAKPARPQFGLSSNALASAIQPVLGAISKTRTREMLVEDFVGFGLMRTAMDLKRQYFFKREPGEKPQLNFPAARERLIREVGSILTDNVSGGVIAYGIAAGANRLMKAKPNFSNQFASNQTLGLFQSALSQSKDAQGFASALAKQVAPSSETAQRLFSRSLMQSGQKLEDAAVAVAKAINPAAQSLDRAVVGNRFAIDELMDDGQKFIKFVSAQTGTGMKGQSWGQAARGILAQTTRINRNRLIIGLGSAMALTMAIPFVNQYITRKVDGLESYPGEMGLRRLKTTRDTQRLGFWDHYFPYMSQSLKSGNLTPALLSLIPLPFAVGMVDTTKLSNGQFKAALNIGKGFWKRAANMLQFGKGFPFTTQQQIASCFAFLIFSRLTTARSDIEFRERMVDSFLGWSIWILATPALKRMFAGASLLKNDPSTPGVQLLKRRVEIERLMPKGLVSKALSRNTLLGAGCLAATLLLMGVIEPWIAIKWTERQSQK